MFCTNCGKEIDDCSSFCPNCRASVEAASDMSPTGRSDNTPLQNSTVSKRLIIRNLISALGAIIILISLTVPWYAIRVYSLSKNVTAADLIESAGSTFKHLDINWALMGLPVILAIIFASLALLAILFSFVVDIRFKRLLNSFVIIAGIISMICVVINAVYFEYRVSDWYAYDGTPRQGFNPVHVGVVMAFVGAIFMSLSPMITFRVSKSIK